MTAQPTQNRSDEAFPHPGFVGKDGVYRGPHNPWLEWIHFVGTQTMSLMAMWTNVQRDVAFTSRQVSKWYGEPLVMQHLQAFTERVLDANVALMDQLSREYAKPEFGLRTTKIDDREVAVTERVVLDKPFCKLLHFERDVDRDDPIVLLIAPQSGHYATLLRPTVERLLPEADVYITDWVNARDVPVEAGPFNLETYSDYLVEMLHLLGPTANVIAICQSTVPAVMAVSRIAEDEPTAQPATLTLMAGPLDPGAAPTDVTELADRMDLPLYLQTWATRAPNGRKVYPGYVQLMAFISMNPDSHLSSHRDLYKYHVADDTNPEIERIERFYQEYFAVADLTAEFYADTVDRVFIKKELAHDSMTYQGRPVRPEAITCPVIGVEGAKDDISAPGQTRDYFAKFTGSSDVSFYEQPNAGHYGVFAGGHWREQIAPRILGKIRETATTNGHTYSDPQRPTQRIEPYTG